MFNYSKCLYKKIFQKGNANLIPLIWKLSNARLPWLVIGILGGLFGAFFLGSFENNYFKDNQVFLSLSFFIPLIMATAGNVGIQVHHLDPINKGDVVWYLYPQDVLTIARLLSDGKYDVSRIVALTGSQVERPRYYRTISGASISNMISENSIKDGNNRFISGNVLTGTQISTDGCIGFYDSQITVIPEGNEQEFLGWIVSRFTKILYV